MKIGIVSNNKFKEKIADDILLKEFLIKDSIDASIISWEEENNYDKFDKLILRSVWGYQNKYSEFIIWLEKMQNKKLYNNSQMIKDNIKKNIQFSILDKYNISHIDTIFSRNIEDIELNKVVKPIISGSGENTFITDEKNIEDIKSKFLSIIKENDNGIMIQPLMDISDGEYACIFIDGINTHNMLRFPGIFSEKKKPIYLDTIPDDVKQLALKVSNIEEFSNCLYMRVDILKANNKTYIMEVELAEPDLMMKYITDEKIKENSIKTLVKSLERK